MENETSGGTKIFWAAAMLVAALFVGLMLKNRYSFKPHTETFGIEVCNLDLNEPCKLSARAAALFSEQSTPLYVYPKGEGVILPLKKIINGKEHLRTFEIKGWEAYQEEHDNNARAKMVADKEVEFNKLIDSWWTNREPDHLKIMVVVDVTGAIEAADIALIGNNVGYRRITESVAAGDSLELTTCLVTDDPKSPCERLIVKQGEPEKAKEVQDRLAALYSQHRDTPQTALVERLRSILAELTRAKSMPEEVIIFSDGMQFSDAADFYKAQHPLLMDEEKWSELEKEVEPEGKPFVDLTGVKFTWFKPGRHMSKAEDDESTKAIAFFAKLLSSHGAKVETIVE